MEKSNKTSTLDFESRNKPLSQMTLRIVNGQNY